jgi:very-short-patch-repair endonuclease
MNKQNTTKRKGTFARTLRKNMTEAEMKLWYKIRNNQLGVKFRRQQPIGNYIVDFTCLEKRIIIEIDGSGHIYNVRDKIRDSWLNKRGYKILRFWNNEVLKNIEGVLISINENL